MKKTMIITSLLAVLAIASPVIAQDEIVFSAEDAAPAIRIFNGYSYNVTVATTAGFNTNGTILVAMYDSAGASLTNTISNGVGTNNTIARLAASAAACTNAAGKALLTVDANCSLAADVTTNTLLTATAAVIAPGQWGTLAAWDTSTALHFDAYRPSRENGGSGDDKFITDIYGNVGGTGDITLNAYIQDSSSGTMTLKYQQSIVSPKYLRSTLETNTVSDNVGPGVVNISDWPAPVHKSQGVLVRASRATTATTGGIGIITKNQ